MRYLGAALVLLGGLALLSFLQKKFDEGDERRALAVILAREPSQDCHATMLSRWRGVVRVDCEGHVWEVDVLRGVYGTLKTSRGPE